MKISFKKFVFLISIIISMVAFYLPAIANPPGVSYNAILLTKTNQSCGAGKGNVWSWPGASACISPSELNGYQGNTLYKTWWPSPQTYVPSKYGTGWVKSQDYNNSPPPPSPTQNTLPSGNAPSSDTNAPSSDTIANTLCILTNALQGNIGKAIATIAIIVLGVGLFLGKISWPLALATAIGIGMIFGASDLVQWISSNSPQGC